MFPDDHGDDGDDGNSLHHQLFLSYMLALEGE